MRPEDLRHWWKLRGLVENPWSTLRFSKRAPESGSHHVVRFRSGPALRLSGDRRDSHIFHRIFLRDEYRVDAARFATVVDVGGNVGIFAARIARSADRVISCEPVAKNFAELERNTAEFPNVEALHTALAGNAGTLRLYHPRDERRTGRHSFAEGKHMSSEYEEVPAITLEQLFEERSIGVCDLLKLDVEGAEYDILHAAPDALFGRIRRIHAEYHDVSRDDPRTRVDAFTSFLRDHGYALDVLRHRRKGNHGMIYATRGE